ncbi:zinc-binding dehydrogenase [Roseibium aestuarii]|uniref:Zinc-binding dehydrogenase n=1 Tax=Roseibium aestuarii TaxID=2600299 RepID=A0ABW4JVT4_9HYPH|nr:zinc-binding dehydrogenase [Roseibium aestuarii]
MKAFTLHQRGPDGCRIGEAPVPRRRGGNVLVRMLAASLNRVDLYMRDNGAGITHDLPLIMGVDGVGEIVEAPEGSSLTPGTRVLLYPYEFCGRCPHCTAGDQPLCLTARIPGEHRDGTLAEFIALPEPSVVPISPQTDPLAAAALGVAYLTAWRMVFGKVPVKPGQTVLVQGAGGGVAFAAGQLARMAGARVIASTTGTDKIARCADEGFEVVDYARDPLNQILSLTGGHGADLVIDNVGEATWKTSLRAARRGGAIVTCGATTGAHPSADLQRLFVRQLSLHGSTMGSLAEFRTLISCFERKAFTVPVDSVFDLDHTRDALARLDHPERFGKVVIRIAAPNASGAL